MCDEQSRRAVSIAKTERCRNSRPGKNMDKLDGKLI